MCECIYNTVLEEEIGEKHRQWIIMQILRVALVHNCYDDGSIHRDLLNTCIYTRQWTEVILTEAKTISWIMRDVRVAELLINN